ncbi:MAG TPA: 4-hydroxy-2-oxovalerate aldolase [Candidatus Bilamarchaeaceae archaeon]|nr:4-hydroxy-2-oxovalerate aldolase [Candidatus Bilamarchaeaceae archaeon]
MKIPLIIDSTLRDGSHAMRHQFSSENITEYAAGAERARVPLLVVGHGNGLGASSLQLGKSLLSDSEMISLARKQLKHTKLGVFIIPGFGTVRDDLKPALSLGADVIFVASHCSEADITQTHINYLKKQNRKAIGVLMMSHMLSADELVEQADKMQEYGAYGVMLMDSAGALLPTEVKERVSALVSNLSIKVGFHAHNNLGCAIANSLAALEAGAGIIDTTSRGLGAGAGNCQLEVFVGVLHKKGIQTEINLYCAMDNSEEIVAKFMKKPQVISSTSLASGLAGVFSGFCPIAEKVSKQFGVDPRDILMELGKRKIVAGQEDYITDVAAELARKKAFGETSL